MELQARREAELGRVLSVSPDSYSYALPKTMPRLANEDLVTLSITRLASLLREISDTQLPRGMNLAALGILVP